LNKKRGGTGVKTDLILHHYVFYIHEQFSFSLQAKALTIMDFIDISVKFGYPLKAIAFYYNR
jgi:hypothetical protein